MPQEGVGISVHGHFPGAHMRIDFPLTRLPAIRPKPALIGWHQHILGHAAHATG